MKSFAGVLSLFILLLPVPCVSWAGDAPSSLLEGVRQKAATIETIRSEFVQEKYLAVFQEALEAQGLFFYRKPDRLRWELTSPVSNGFVLHGKTGRRWNKPGDKGEEFDIERDPVMHIVAEQLFAWTQADFARLKHQYRIEVAEKSPVRLKLYPLSDATAGFLDHLLITFNPDGQYVQQVEIHERGGDYTRITFQNVQVNGPMIDDLF